MEHKKIAITGATGFLGNNLTEKLLNEGYIVSILARDKEKADSFKGSVSKIVLADVTDKEAIKELVDGVDIVIHLVSNFRTASGPPESYRQINVEGTKNVLYTSINASVERFVYCSTIGVHGNVSETPATELSPYNPGDLYQETKLEAELLCQNEIGKSDMEITIIRPCSMYGPGDLRMLKMFKMLSKRTFLMLGPCKENFHAIYIDDIVNGFLLAMNSREAAGQVFIIGGKKFLPLKEYIGTVAKAVGAPMPWLRFPYWLFYYMSVVCEGVCVPFGLEPPLHRRRVRFYKNNRAFSIEKARKILGFDAKVGLEEGMKRTVAWYKENGYL